MGQMVYLKDVVSLQLFHERCVGCGMCLQVCPQGVLIPSDGKVQIQHRDACIECGACALNCPVEAITVRPGVGCAAAVINSALGRKSACCSLESEDSAYDCGDDKTPCC